MVAVEATEGLDQKQALPLFAIVADYIPGCALLVTLVLPSTTPHAGTYCQNA